MLKKSKILELVTKSLSILGMKVKVKTYRFDFAKEMGKSKSSALIRAIKTPNDKQIFLGLSAITAAVCFCFALH